MAEVAMPTMPRHHRQTSSVNSINAAGVMPRNAPKIEMRANPDFTFPMQPQGHASSLPRPATSRRHMSMQIDPTKSETSSAPALGPSLGHRKAKSTLPSFVFNQQDSSGLQDSPSPPITPTDPTAPPSRRGHRRGGSELVGGDSRFGVTSAVSSSPTKTNALPVPIAGPVVAPPGPSSEMRHRHRRSGAVSSSDVTNIMKPKMPETQLSSSLPNTPTYNAGDTHTDSLKRATTAPIPNDDKEANLPSIEIDDTLIRPQSKQRSVGFSDAVEYIPQQQRPLSTISSETESSSHNNSISSMLSLSSPSPPSQRAQRPTLSTTPEDEPGPKPRSSAEISRRIEKEGEWLRSVSAPDLKRPQSESVTTPTSITFAEQDQPQATPRPLHRKRHSLGHALGFDRRKSEPTISTSLDAASRLSAISLQETSPGRQPEREDNEEGDAGHRLSTRKIKSWAIGKMSRKSKDHAAQETEAQSVSTGPYPSEESVVPGAIPVPAEIPVAETDLDAVFSDPSPLEETQRVGSQTQPVYETSVPTPNQYTWDKQCSSGDSSPMVDLDAALGPLRTPVIGSHRRQLHSSRGGKEFGGGFSGTHQRALSLPTLSPFENPARIGTPSQTSMADVFEEDEEDEGKTPSSSRPSTQLEESSMGVSIVDSDNSLPVQRTRSSVGEGLGIQSGGWEIERPSTSHGQSYRLSAPLSSDRRASLVEETILEESSPAESPQAQHKRIEALSDEEEPRSSSLTKSSDSSETPTILAPLPPAQPVSQTPDTFQTSTFSSPDLGRRQSSFEASRTTASSIADNRTTASSNRISVDDVPSLTSSRSTMMSNILAHNNNSRRDFSDRSTSIASVSSPQVQDFAVTSEERRKKRSSIQSLSQLMGGSFHGKHPRGEEARPQTANLPAPMEVVKPKKKERETTGHHRLKKLMFWKNKNGGEGGGDRRHRSVSGM
ncbi:hypothetical protein MBLNU230_g7103t1 [Neophaeotheca triangularis]